MKVAVKVAAASMALASMGLLTLQPATAQTIAPAASFDTPRAAHTTDIQVGFSPEGTADPLVLSFIRSAQQSLHVMAYEMKEIGIVRALEERAGRGVDVEVEADYRENLGDGSNDYTRARLAELAATPGVHVCIVSAFPVFHDKVMIADRRSLEVGSYNYSRQAKERNSENALVIWNRPDIALQYEDHFHSRLPVCQPYRG
jgi:phosphatidylserine/phosphatidylglycerophosphate/cardiolipin synthase-like enzyme